jgi:hypothetical protein
VHGRAFRNGRRRIPTHIPTRDIQVAVPILFGTDTTLFGTDTTLFGTETTLFGTETTLFGTETTGETLVERRPN